MSLRITNGMVQRRVLADLHSVSGRLVEVQTKVSSGKEISKPSDDPFAASRSLSLRESLGGIRQQADNVEDGRGWQEAAESAMARITDAVQRARELLIQGASDGSDATARANLAQEIDELVNGVKENVNTSYKGQYVFSGTEVDTPPYAMDPADDTYKGDSGVVAREVGPGVSIAINQPGISFLGGGQAAGDDKLLHVLRDVAEHLRAGDGVALRENDLPRLQKSLEDMLEVRAVNGARANRLEAAATRIGELELATMSQLSDTEDVDMARALIDFSSQQAAYQASLRAGASIMQVSLMDFLR